MYIQITGANKSEIRKSLHDAEERGIAFLKCIKEERLTDVKYNKIITKGYTMTFLCENQYANIEKVNLENETQLINSLAAMSNYSKKELKENFLSIKKESCKRMRGQQRLDMINKLGFIYLYVDHTMQCIYSSQMQ